MFVHFPVLELVTLPNILLAFAQASNKIGDHSDELELSPDFIQSFEHVMQEQDISLCFFHGDWADYTSCDALLPKYDLILSSETIYDNATIPRLVRILKDKSHTSTECLIAAKVIYFGLSGGLSEFQEKVELSGGKMGVIPVKSTGPERVIVSVQWD